MHEKYAWFLNKSEENRKYWIKLTWVLRWLIKVSGVLASRQILALTLSYCLVIFLLFKLSLDHTYFGYVRKL